MRNSNLLPTGNPYCDAGFLVNKDISYLICVMPILKSGAKGKPVGTFTFIVKYNNAEIRNITNLDASLFTVSEQDIMNPLRGNAYEIKNNHMATMKMVISNLGSARSSVLQFDQPRTLYTKGGHLSPQQQRCCFFCCLLRWQCCLSL